MNSGKLAPPTAVTINSTIETGYARAEELSILRWATGHGYMVNPRAPSPPCGRRFGRPTCATGPRVHMALELGMRRSTLTMIDVRTDLHCDGTGQVNVVSFAEEQSIEGMPSRVASVGLAP